jgi:predicted RNA-binding protein with PUA-like domain
VVKEFYQDPTTEDQAWVVVDVAPIRKLKKAVSLAQIKAEPRLSKMEIVRLSRLSVTSVTNAEWKVILELAGE